jgi:hypothetical protein
MAKRKLTPMEQAVGRALPKEPTHLDTLMNRHLDEKDEPRGRFAPTGYDSHLQPAHRKARKNGWLRADAVGFSIMGSPVRHIFRPTEAGLIAAREARARVNKRQAERNAWCEDARLIHVAARAAKEAKEKEDTQITAEHSA